MFCIIFMNVYSIKIDNSYYILKHLKFININNHSKKKLRLRKSVYFLSDLIF